MRLASLAMYVQPPELADATQQLWRFIQGRLTDIGMVDIPGELDRNIAHDAAWLHPDLLLSQTCGYPYVTSLRGRVRLVATPIYNHAGCEGPLQCSFIIVRRDQMAVELSDMRNCRAAINDDASNSGMNVLRAAIAPLAIDGHFFSDVIKTGGHLQSIEAVATSQADVAAIDCVTFGNIRRFNSTRLSNVRILAQTAKTPGLPFITRGDATDDDVAGLQQILQDASVAPSLAATRDALSLVGFQILPDTAYDRVLELEAKAVRAGYPVIA